MLNPGLRIFLAVILIKTAAIHRDKFVSNAHVSELCGLVGNKFGYSQNSPPGGAGSDNL